MSSIPDYAEQLRTADLRVTRPRVAVLEAVNAHPHADTETIFGAVRFALPDVSRQGYFGPCPPAGTGTHHYRFTLYHLPVALQLPPGATGVQAAQAIAQAASGQARLVGTFEG
ncbi:hypothetical protein [Mycobacterium tuberculosis]|uniref:hypothetical protein n=1 Tax=Mycobacterium tuberculosis TaxID=1773 RepID=UPI0009953DBF|nr:hypothetical protein [Mycobacterium tuberculosis]